MRRPLTPCAPVWQADGAVCCGQGLRSFFQIQQDGSATTMRGRMGRIERNRLIQGQKRGRCITPLLKRQALIQEGAEEARCPRQMRHQNPARHLRLRHVPSAPHHDHSDNPDCAAQQQWRAPRRLRLPDAAPALAGFCPSHARQDGRADQAKRLCGRLRPHHERPRLRTRHSQVSSRSRRCADLPETPPSTSVSGICRRYRQVTPRMCKAPGWHGAERRVCSPPDSAASSRPCCMAICT